MAVKIGTNIASLNAQRQVGQSTQALERTFERLSSGMRINRASDDAAGLAVSSSLRSDSRIFAQAIRNVNDGISLLNIAEGAVGQLSNVTMRIRELAFQSANGTYSRTQRTSMDSEADALIKEYNRVLGSTTFNGRQLLTGELRELALQLGRGDGSTLIGGVGAGVGRVVGTGDMSWMSTHTTSHGARSVETADINGDGIADLVYGSSSQSNAFKYSLGNGDGTFRAEVSIYGEFASQIRVGDFNNDGNVDIMGVGNGASTLVLALGNGDGTFNRAVTYNTQLSDLNGLNVDNFSFADLDNDGDLDVIVRGDAGSQFSFLRGNGDGTFQLGQARNIANTDTNTSINFGDIDGDGNIDLIYNLSGANQGVAIEYGNGDGSFRARSTLNFGTDVSTSIAIADINGDGLLDIASVNNTGQALRVRLGNGDGTFQGVVSSQSNLGYYRIKSGDVNNDGVLDLYGIRYDNGLAEMLVGNGDGTFASPRTFSTGLTTRFGGTLIDVDGNGVMEYAVGGNSNNIGIIFQNQGFSANLESMNLNTREGAYAALAYLDSATERIQKELGNIGSLMSRLNVASRNLSVSREQYLAAASRITDVDVAEESSALVRTQILQKTGAAVLAQANLQPELALRLLRGG